MAKHNASAQRGPDFVFIEEQLAEFVEAAGWLASEQRCLRDGLESIARSFNLLVNRAIEYLDTIAPTERKASGE